MALGIWGLLIALATPAAAQTTLGVGEVQILPRVDGTDTGSIRLREKNANGQDAVRISAPDAVTSGGYRVRMPAAQGTGALTNDGSGNLSWEAAAASGPFVNIMDYGAANDCSVTISNIGGAWDQAYAALGSNGGVIYFPPGCYGIDSTLNIGNGTSTTTSTKHSVTLLGAGVSAASASAGATIIRWIGTVPISTTPMVKFFGPIHGGGIRDIQLDAALNFRIAAVHQFNHIGGYFSNVTIMRPAEAPMWYVLTNTTAYGTPSERNVYQSINMNECYLGSAGIYLESVVSGLPTRDNTFSGGKICYDGSNLATYYGLRLRYTERNSFTGMSFEPYSGSGSNAYGIWLDGYSGDTTYPKNNTFTRVYSPIGPGEGSFGSGTGGNFFVDVAPSAMNSIGVKGFSSGNLFGNPNNPPRVLGTHDVGQDTFVVNQQSGAYNSGGSIGFMRQSDIVGRIAYESFSGITFSAYNLSVPGLLKYWQINQDGVFESAGSGGNIGRTSNRVNLYSTFLDTSFVSSNLVPFLPGKTTGTLAAPWSHSYASNFSVVGGFGSSNTKILLDSSGITPLGNVSIGDQNLGSSILPWNEIYVDNAVVTTDLGIGPVGNAKVYFGGTPYGTAFMLNAGGSVTIQMDAGAGQILTTGLITGNGFRSGSSTGITASCSGGQKLVNPQVVGGIVVGGTCGF